MALCVTDDAAGADGACLARVDGGGVLLLSSTVIAILKLPSTIMTTLAPTSRERIFDVMVDGCFGAFSLSPAGAAMAGAAFALAGLAFALPVVAWAAAAAWAARRAAAMKLVELAGSGAALEVAFLEIALMAFSDAAIRSDGEAWRALGRVPGSSG